MADYRVVAIKNGVESVLLETDSALKAFDLIANLGHESATVDTERPEYRVYDASGAIVSRAEDKPA